MDSLPLEVVEDITQYLTPQDLAACCAVSWSWRYIFNQDRIWRPHCDKLLARYLETTECKVDPKFVSPESEDCTLTPICHWWLCFMRENHLLNNWRRGKFVEDTKEYAGRSFPFTEFVCNEYALTVSKRRLILWNLENGINYVTDNRILPIDILHFEVLDPNMIVIFIKPTTVKIYHFKSILDKTWDLKHAFRVNETETLSFSEVQQTNPILYYFYLEKIFCNIFVGYSKHEDVLHIWDVKEGKKLSTVENPMALETYEIIQSNKASEVFLVVLHDEQSINKYHFFVYSLNLLKFLPFSVNHDIPFHFECILLDKFVAITVNGPTFIYNYHSSQLVLKVPTTSDSNMLAIGNKILFTKSLQFYMVLNTHTLELQQLTENSKIVSTDIRMEKALFGNFFFISSFGRSYIYELKNDCSILKMPKMPRLGLIESYFSRVNQYHTKAIKMKFDDVDCDNLHLFCYTFW